MKKIYIVLSVALLASAACTKFKEETTPAGLDATVAAPSIEQVADDELDTDNAFKVKITPAGGNNYYSFVVVKGTLSCDAETLLTLGYEKKSVTVKKIVDEVEADVPLSGSFLSSAQADTTVHAYSLTPNTTYTVYAVANDKNGVLSKVSSLAITTTDKVAPTTYYNNKFNFSSSNLEDGTMVLTFDDPVSFTDALKDGSAKFYATYLSANATHLDDGYTEFDQIFTAPIPVDSLSVSGANVSIQVPERIPGAAVLITYDAGVVVNGTKLENEANAYGGAYYNKEKPAFYGICARFKTASWKFDRPLIEDENTGELVRMPADTIIYFQDAEETGFALTAQKLAEPQFQDKKYNKIVPAVSPQITYTDGDLRQISYPAKKGYVAVVQDSILVTYLSEVPDYGSYVAIAVAEESVEDLWGNPCQEFSTVYVDEDKNIQQGNYFFSYGYKVEDLYGTYTLTATPQYGEAYTDNTIIIAPAPADDEDYKGMDVIIQNLFNATTCCDDLDSFTNLNTSFGASFNPHNGVLQFGWYDAIGIGALAKYSWNNYVLALSFETEDNTFAFQQPEKGKLTSINTITVYLYNLGTWDRYSAGGMILNKISDSYSAPEVLTAAPQSKKMAGSSEFIPSSLK